MNIQSSESSKEEEDEDQALDQTSQEQKVNCQKLIRNGQILILRGDHTYTVQGQEVK